MSLKSPRRMVPSIRARHNAISNAPGYWRKVLGFGPIAYWPLWEAAGVTAQCLVNPAQNGIYTSVSLRNGLTPWGDPAPFFDGINDVVDIFTATIQAAYNHAEGAVFFWAKVGNAAAWTDGIARNGFSNFLQAGNYEYIQKSAVNDTLRFQYSSGGSFERNDPTPITTTDWFSVAMSWSQSADLVAYYIDGGQVATDAGLVAPAGALTQMTISSAGNLWHGWLAHCILFDRAIGPTDVAALDTY